MDVSDHAVYPIHFQIVHTVKAHICSRFAVPVQLTKQFPGYSMRMIKKMSKILNFITFFFFLSKKNA